ncbi:MAG: hypothetical protein JWR83_2525 [Aeromicrobium sp.]|nr:hypothetical protein [Aeromicrobium sp.]
MSAILGRTRYIVLAVVVLLIVSALLVLRGSNTTVVAYFSTGTGLYKGDEVRVLGVKVGTVQSIRPEGDKVRVELSVKDSQPIPADAKAAIVAPSLVNGRFVQLAPVYVGGPKMKSGATIPVTRTAVPVSFDEVKKELTDLSTALGPGSGGVAKGTLNEAVTTIDANLKGGTAAQLRTSIAAMRAAAGDLSDNRGDLFSTIQQLNTFTKNLVVNDSALRGATSQLTEFSSVLDDNKGQLATAIQTLDQALKLVTGFVKDNTDVLSTSVSSVGKLSKTVADKSNTLAQLLHVAPDAAEGLYNSVEDSAVTGRVALGNFQGAAQLLCGSILGVGGTVEQCRAAIDPLLKVLGLTEVPGAPGVGIPGLNDASADGTGAQALVSSLSTLLGNIASGGGAGTNATGSSGLLGILSGGAN